MRWLGNLLAHDFTKIVVRQSNDTIMLFPFPFMCYISGFRFSTLTHNADVTSGMIFCVYLETFE